MTVSSSYAAKEKKVQPSRAKILVEKGENSGQGVDKDSDICYTIQCLWAAKIGEVGKT